MTTPCYGRALAVMMLAAAAVFVVGVGMGLAEKTWYVDDDGGAGYLGMQIVGAEE